MGIRFEFLRAGKGDCILVSTDEGTNILIDGGVTKTYVLKLKAKIEEMENKNLFLDLVILTHYDDDHIAGLLKLLDNEKYKIEKGYSTVIKEFWFNSFDNALVDETITSYKTSSKQQIKFDEYIKELTPYINYRALLSTDNKIDFTIGKDSDIKLTLLSPNDKKLEKLFNKYQKENKNYQTSSSSNDYNFSVEELSEKEFIKDNSLTNGASIAFILHHENMNFLLLGDAHIDCIVNSLKRLGYSSQNRLDLEFVKLSHHGSSKNLNREFLDLIDSKRFVISTNGGRHQHPNKETLSKIVTYAKRDKDEDIEFIYNYEHCRDIFTPTEKREYKAIFKNEILNF